jgi:predicted acyltransferase
MFLAGFPRFNFHTIRIPGVLQRIAIAAAIFMFTKVRGQMLWIVGLLALYWYLMAGDFSKEHNFARYVDGLVHSGHMWRQTKTWDPEGLVSTLPPIASTLFGVLAGHILRVRTPVSEIAAWIFCFGNALLFVGLVLNTWMPINKSLWTD